MSRTEPTVLLLTLLGRYYGRSLEQVYRRNEEPSYIRLQYEELARKLEFPIVAWRDITRHTMPKYRAIKKFERMRMGRNPEWFHHSVRANRFLWLCALLRLLHYTVVCYEKPARDRLSSGSL